MNRTQAKKFEKKKELLIHFISSWNYEIMKKVKKKKYCASNNQKII